MKKFFIIFFSITAFLVLVLLLFVFILYLQSFSVKLDKNKLNRIQNNITYFDDMGNEIKDAHLSGRTITGEVPKRFAEFLTLIEDREFFNHNGVNVKRMFGAFISNLKSFSFKEGASTITQQLIKNTHLTSEKTLKRKFTEIRLSRKLEKEFTKQEILTMYANIIYFGSGFYGLENASYGYFNKSSYDLTDNEYALFVGLIKAPTRYSPINNYDRSIERKNFVLKTAYEHELITLDEYERLKKTPIEIVNIKNENYTDSYFEGVQAEIVNILNEDIEDFSLKNYKIYTYFDEKIQKELYLSHKNIDYTSNNIFGSQSVVIDNKQNGITAYYNKNKGNTKRQIGSLIKPLFVYAPAFENKLITPLTPILDEKISYGGYSPKNFDNSYDGYISVKDALKRSKNVPAVKVLEYVGIDNAKNFIKKLGINLDNEENNLSLALGGTKSGIDIFSLTNAYTIFANGGKHTNSHFIKKIENENGKIIFENANERHEVMKSSTAYLITDILKECSKSGTGRKMKDFDFEIATKTGTVGNTNGNSDAYSVSFSQDYTVCSHLFSEDNNTLMGGNVLGGNHPTIINRDCFLSLENDSKIINKIFEVPINVVNLKIDKYSYLYEQKIELASSLTPIEYHIMQYFDSENTPHIVSNRFSRPEIENYEISINDDILTLKIPTKPYYFYEVYKIIDDKKRLINEFSTNKSEYELIEKLEKNKVTTFEIIPYFMYENQKIYGESLTTQKLLI